MAETYTELVSRARDWFERAATAGWFGESHRRRFAAVERATPADLFVDRQVRPLVVALFGGTGVGKSSLLNRAAGSPIARVGAERPTSRDVTLYVHESVGLADLPPELPLERVQAKRHDSAPQRDVLWIDAPDIDSTAEANRRCALAWLPHVDLLCYVVSPERYRDDLGWRVLRERGHKHGWLFVMNRWDEGDVRQRADFISMLRAAGFDDPLLFCTCCADGQRLLPSPDEFEQVQGTLRELLDAHAVRELTRLGQVARLRELCGPLEELQQRFGDDEHWEEVKAALGERWQSNCGQLVDGAAWTMQTVAARFAIREGSVVQRLMGSIGVSPTSLRAPGAACADSATAVALSPIRAGGLPATPVSRDSSTSSTPDGGELAALTTTLWDDWTQAKVAACVDAAEITASRCDLAIAPLRRRLDEVAHTARETVLAHTQDQVRVALAAPGGRWVRLGRRLAGSLGAVLPTAALVWVGYALVVGYYAATHGQGPFLGGAFAIHSGLLVLVAWALPFLLRRMLKPSLEKVVLTALRQGFARGLHAVAADLESAVTAAAAEARQFREEAESLRSAATGLLPGPLDERQRALARAIAGGAAWE